MSSSVQKSDPVRTRGSEAAPVRAAEPDISLEEREEILAQIEQTVAKSRNALGPDGLLYKSERSGVALPLVVNLVAALLIAAAAVFFVLFSDRDEQSIAARPSASSPARGRSSGRSSGSRSRSWRARTRRSWASRAGSPRSTRSFGR